MSEMVRTRMHVEPDSQIGRRLRDSRLRARRSQRDLAFPGCTAVYICRIENGDRVPSLQVIHELADRLGVDREWLARGVEPAPPVDLIGELYGVADNHEAALLNNLRHRAGHIWECHVCPHGWTNRREENDECVQCGTPRAEAEREDEFDPAEALATARGR